MLNSFICSCHSQKFESEKKLKEHIYNFQYAQKHKEERKSYMKVYREEHIEESIKYSKEYNLKLEVKERLKKWKEDNKEKLNKQSQEYRNRPDIKKKAKIYNKLNWVKNREKIQKINRLSDLKNKDKRNIYHRDRFRNNLNVNIKNKLTVRIYNALKGQSKSKSTYELLGCSIEDFKKYLESKFKEGMSWKNYSFYGWHIDHIKPCANFDLSKIEEQKKCFHYTNLQPLWAEENWSKGSSL